jgi:TolB-like protein
MATQDFKRKLTAILSADVKGYCRLMGEDEEATVRTITAHRKIITSVIEKYRGRVVDSPGDNILAEFVSVVDAMQSGVEIQEVIRAKNAELPEERRMAFPLPERPSIAVLPFVNLSGDPSQDYLSDGTTETIITALSKISTLFVIARNSAFTYKGKTVNVQQVAEDLGVRYVLEGSVQRAGERVRINAQLVDGLTGRHLWAERYDREIGDIFALQDDITNHVVTALEVKLTEGEAARKSRRQTDNSWAGISLL